VKFKVGKFFGLILCLPDRVNNI